MTKEELEKENAELKTEKIPRLERKIASIRGALPALDYYEEIRE